MATCLTSGLHRAASKSDKLPHSGPANVTGPEGWQWAAGCVPGLRCAGGALRPLPWKVTGPALPSHKPEVVQASRCFMLKI